MIYGAKHLELLLQIGNATSKDVRESDPPYVSCQSDVIASGGRGLRLIPIFGSRLQIDDDDWEDSW